MSTPITSSGPWLTLVGSLVTCMLHFSSTTCTSYMISRYIVYGWPSCQWDYYHSVWIHPPIPHPAGWKAQTHSILLCAHHHPLRHIGTHHVENHNLSSLHVLGSMGEPITTDAWNWYNKHVSKMQCGVVDTFWYVLHILLRSTDAEHLQANRNWVDHCQTIPWCYQDRVWLHDCSLLWHWVCHSWVDISLKMNCFFPRYM